MVKDEISFRLVEYYQMRLNSQNWFHRTFAICLRCDNLVEKRDALIKKLYSKVKTTGGRKK